MKFEGYQYKFNLNASHHILINDKRNQAHLHTFKLSLFIKTPDQKFVLYSDMEQLVESFLHPYSNEQLNQIPPFDELEPTLENIGDIFFDKLKVVLKDKGMTLVQLEISETPARVYIVKDDEDNMDGEMLAKLFMHSMTELSSKQVMNQLSNRQDGHGDLEVKTGNINTEKLAPLQTAEKNEMDTEIFGVGETSSHNAAHLFLKIAAALLILIITAIALVSYIKQKAGAPWGADIYGHIFKADLLYSSIKNGDFYPLFTKAWYNGIQPFRYWAPVPYYILAACEFLTQGNVEKAYSLFIGFAFLAGALGWLLWGIKEKRVFVGLAFGVLWFFIPDNARVFFSEGNIPRVVITLLIPYLFYFLWQFVSYKKRWAMVPMALVMMLIILSHLMIAAMIGIASFMYLLIYALIHKEILKPFQILLAMLLSFAACGIWVYPALFGGLLAMDSEATSDVMKSLSIPFTISLNPFLRMQSTGYFYYGLSVVGLAVFGVLFSNKKSLPGFMTAIVIFLGTTTAFVPLLIKLPLNQLLWMIRFTPMAYGFFMMSMLNWKKCKNYIVAVMLILLALDSSLSFNLPLYAAEKPTKITHVLDTAKKITMQRILLLDNSLFGSYPSYYIGAVDEKRDYAYGWAWQGAATAENIVLLNTALEKGYYIYMFDRAVEMGCDTVIIRKASLPKDKKDWEHLRVAAELSAYQLYEETEESYVLHRDTPKQFGVITNYEGLCIGKSASYVTLQYPYFEKGRSQNIEDYTLEMLSQYKVIYLSDFRYNVRSKAEALLKKLGDKGIKIIIDMNRIPVDLITNRMTFLGVTAQPITLETKLPELFMGGQVYRSKAFEETYEKWNTVYLDNLPKMTGFSWIEGKRLSFAGTDLKGNIIFLGFNLMFHEMQTDDKEISSLLDTVTGVQPLMLPEREIAAIEAVYSEDQISIRSPKDDLNTTIAYLDAYRSKDDIVESQKLLKVGKGITTVKIIYPYLVEGLLVSLIGSVGLALLLIFTYKRKGD